MFRYLSWLLVIVLAVVAAGWWLARPATPDAFYRPPGDRKADNGTLLRQESFTRGVPSGAKAWRVLYATTRAEGTPAVASAIVMVSASAATGPRPVIAWTHGTTGVAPGCASSLLEQPFANVPALHQLIDQGWIFVATDYVGLGTGGSQSYLIGEAEARSALDSIRAVRQVQGIHASDDVVVWGHSQGGHAALWTGILGPTYAPEIAILGVAAVAPASDLRPLIEALQGKPVGSIMSSLVLSSYSDVYPEVSFDTYVRDGVQWIARDLANRCLAGPQALLSVAETFLAGNSIFAVAPTSGAFGARLAQNTPDRPMSQPLLIAQGLADDLVLPEVQARFVRERCSAGQALEYRKYPGRDHLSVVAPDSPLTEDLVQWTLDRINGATWSDTCDR